MPREWNCCNGVTAANFCETCGRPRPDGPLERITTLMKRAESQLNRSRTLLNQALARRDFVEAEAFAGRDEELGAQEVARTGLSPTAYGTAVANRSVESKREVVNRWERYHSLLDSVIGILFQLEDEQQNQLADLICIQLEIYKK